MSNYNYKQVKSFDMALSAALFAEGFSLVGVEKTQYSSKASFVFERKDGIDEIIQRYWANDLLVNPRLYFDSIKHLKTRLYSGV